jgi:hypothetical protein
VWVQKCWSCLQTRKEDGVNLSSCGSSVQRRSYGVVYRQVARWYISSSKRLSSYWYTSELRKSCTPGPYETHLRSTAGKMGLMNQLQIMQKCVQYSGLSWKGWFNAGLR